MRFYLEEGTQPIANWANIICMLEDKYNCQCLFGAVFSTYVFGIQNAASDRDCRVITDGESKMFRVYSENADNDICVVGYGNVLKNQNLYLETLRDFPSCLYREQDENGIFENEDRNDYYTGVIFETLVSNFIWDSGYLKDNFEGILQDLSVKGIMDYYYSRAYGNWKNNLRKESVLCQKYMTTLIGLCCMRWIAEKHTIPRLDYCALVNEYVPKEYKAFFNQILIKHQNVAVKTSNIAKYHLYGNEETKCIVEEKPKAYTMPNDSVNNWIYMQLQNLKNIIADMPDNLRFSISYEQWMAGKQLIEIES